MNCPKCGAENPDNTQRCGSCGCVLKRPDIVQPNMQARTSKLAILSLVLGVLSLPFFVLAGLPAMIVAIVSIVRISGSGGRLKGMPVALAGIIDSILMMCVFAVLWCFDAPPIPDDYTLADFRSAPTECAESFEILKTLIDESWSLPGAPAIGLTKEDIKIIDEASEVIENGSASQIAESLSRHAAEIDQAWTRAEKARGVIRRLNEFPQIADLTEPRIGDKTMRWHNLIELARLYQAYANLQTEADDIYAVIADLIELDSVFRKLSPNVRVFIEKLICLMCIEENMVTANAIVNNPVVARESVELLARHFRPLTNEQMSLRNGMLSEYFFMKDVVSEVSGQTADGKMPLLKTNSTLRVYRNYCDNWLDAIKQNGHVATRLSAWPNYYPFRVPDPLPTRGLLPMIYRCYNPLGSRCIHTFGFSRNIDAKNNYISVSEDLFQIVLNKRLGKEVSLKARAYSDEYIVDVEGRKIFSPGPDGKPNTRDDIKLSINPELLGW